MYHFVYKTTNKINKKIYIGQHTTSNINDGYIGSGDLIKKAISKYGKDNFDFEIIEFCQSIKELNEREYHYIEDYNSLNPNGYNLRPGGNYYPLSEKSLAKMSRSRKGQFLGELNPNWKAKSFTIETIKKISNSIKERYEKYPSYKKAVSKNSKNLRHSEETKEKISIANSGNKNGRYLEFSESQIHNIIHFYTKNNISLTKLGRLFGVATQTIKRILTDNNIIIIKRTH